MAIETPPELVAAIEAEIQGLPASLSKQIRALSELFHLFTAERSILGRTSYLDAPKLRSAYLRYHLPLNVARATRVLGEVLRVHPEARDFTRVFDLGAGPGTASLATLFSLPRNLARVFVLEDRSRAALASARRILERSSAAGGISSLTTRVRALPGLPAMEGGALVWLSMVLNELQVGAPRGLDPRAFIERLALRLSPGSVVIAMEPALRVPGRNLLRLHDEALAAGGWRVLAPCTHQASCPLLVERDRSWCHVRFEWRAPRFVREVADPLGLEHREPSVAYLALERVRASGEPATAASARARVIGDAMEVHGGKRGIYICREGRRELIVPPPPGSRRGDVVVGGSRGVIRVETGWGR